MSLYVSDFYKIEVSFPVDEMSYDILNLLYQPIIGSRALNLYMTMMSEGKRMRRFIQPCSLSRLSTLIGIDLRDLEASLKVLEGISLLRSYVRYENEMTCYLYVLQAPYSQFQFFRNDVLQPLLLEAIGKEDFEKTKTYFRVYQEKKDNYDEITVSFNDVFDVDGKSIEVDETFLNNYSRELRMEYDFDLLYKELRDHQISSYIFKKEDETIISQLGTLYRIEPIIMSTIIKDSITRNRLDHDLFKKNIDQFNKMQSSEELSSIYLKQPIQYKINNNSDSDLMKHFKYLETVSPYELLKDKQGGKEPVLHDLQIVESLMNSLELTPGVTNILIEYVLGTNNNRLTRSYCEAIGSSWARKNIKTVQQAYKEIHPEEKKVEVKKEKKVEKKVENESIDDEFDRLFKKLVEEGKL